MHGRRALGQVGIGSTRPQDWKPKTGKTQKQTDIKFLLQVETSISLREMPFT
jgi:hypothetical protein